MHKRVYCKKQFLDEFKAQQPDLTELNDKNIKQMQNWLCFLAFLSKSNLCFDITQEEYNKLKVSDIFFNRIWKKSTQGECGLEFCQSDFPEINDCKIKHVDDDFLNSIILTIDSDLNCRQTSANYGIMVMNPKMALACSHLFADNGIAIPNDMEDSWDFLDKIGGKAIDLSVNNSVIIADNYIFDNAEKSIDSNLLPILKSILPFQLEDGVICHVTIYTKANDENADLCSELYDKIKAARSELIFQINIINVAETRSRPDGSSFLFSKYFHDRAIITNHLLISSGHGFDVFPFNKDRDKPTNINVIFPHFQSTINWAERSYENLIETARKVNANNHKYKSDYWGDEGLHNRLIDKPNKKKVPEASPVPAAKEPEIFTIPVPKLAGIKDKGKIDLSKFQERNRFPKHT